jgi:hypothetical protein
MQALCPDGSTPHGFRSSFRDWCGEESAFPREIAEQSLAHATGNAVEQAYRRGDALEKRRALMEAWAAAPGRERGRSARIAASNSASGISARRSYSGASCFEMPAAARATFLGD